MTIWPTPCETEFQLMSLEDPILLQEWIESGELSPGLLARALEALGAYAYVPALPTIMKHLQHGTPFIREGAVLGLAPYLDSAKREQVKEVLANVAALDTSPGVSATARDVLEECEP